MGIKINPFNPGLIDFIGSGGGSAVQSPNYFQTFNVASWGAPSGGFYSIIVTSGTHNKGNNPIVQVYELISGNYEIVVIPIIVNSGNITITVSETPDSRFEGKIIISENN